MEKKTGKIGKIILIIISALVGILVGFTIALFAIHKAKSDDEALRLKELGYYNPVSVGDHSLNVFDVGKKDGDHTIVAIAGFGCGDISVTMRKMTAPLEKDNRVVFVDRAGYGFSDDTNERMTAEFIVEDYRKALKNAGIEAPYVLMPHSVGGVYANYWTCKYPDEIEAVCLVDGSQISGDMSAWKSFEVGFSEKAMAFGAKLGYGRLLLRKFQRLYPDNYTDEEQYLGDALQLMTMDSIAISSEEGIMAHEAEKVWDMLSPDDIPKLYICASWGIEDMDTLVEYNKWMNKLMDKNNIKVPRKPVDPEKDGENMQENLDILKQWRDEDLMPYIEKMGNCQLVLIGGNHLIYEQRPDDCAEEITKFLDGISE